MYLVYFALHTCDESIKLDQFMLKGTDVSDLCNHLCSVVHPHLINPQTILYSE